MPYPGSILCRTIVVKEPRRQTSKGARRREFAVLTFDTVESKRRGYAIAWGGCALTGGGFVLFITLLWGQALPAAAMMIAGVIMAVVGIARGSLSLGAGVRPGEGPAADCVGPEAPSPPRPSWRAPIDAGEGAGNRDVAAGPAPCRSRALLAVPLALALALCGLLVWVLSLLGQQ